MRIYSMTATFGKLEHQTLTLKPGLNIIEAPNEWGKSTWSAFLVAMLYGIDTRERTKGEHLADKERYAPWSGAPMSGRMDLCWDGRDITIERSTKGRSVFGVFRAYETATGLDIPELTAANCGQTLLGVEKSVFTRAGFLKLTDLPVTQDETLRRRLNALVTTGDESSAGDVLAQKLRNLKNQCKSNAANGLIPKAEAERNQLEEKLQKRAQLLSQSQRIQQRQQSLQSHLEQLENHQMALRYAAAQDQTQKAAAARLHLESIGQTVQDLQEICGKLPTEETLLHNLRQLNQLRHQQEAVRMDLQMLPPAPTPPDAPAAFHGCAPEQALSQAQQDTLSWNAAQKAQKKPLSWPIFASLLPILCAVALLILGKEILSLVLFVPGVALMLLGLVLQGRQKRANQQAQAKADLLLERYRPLPPEQWVQAALDFAHNRQAYETQSAAHAEQQQALREKYDQLQQQLMTLTGGLSYLEAEQTWKDALSQHDALSRALREQKQAQTLASTLESDHPLPQPPQAPDALTYTAQQTARMISDSEFERHQLQLQLGNTQGQMDALGREEDLLRQLNAVNARLERLNETYDALELAQKTLQDASATLQRRFAPRISRRAQELFGKLTDNRYDRLTLGQDLNLSIGAQGEDTLHGSLWRSDGTVDQLYFALRLAVAEELTPNAPLILDDALVRFDDARLKAAMEILKESSEIKQVILFTCQSRESALYNP